MDPLIEKRITQLNNVSEHDGECVMYWMQSSQRVSDNPALELAVERANTLDQPLMVFYSIDPSIPLANERNFTFMLEGLKDVANGLETIGATFCIRHGSSMENAAEVSMECDASLVVTDESHLNHGRDRRDAAAQMLKVPLYQVDSNVIVPVREIPGEQYAAYTIRPKLMDLLEKYLRPAKKVDLKNHKEVEVSSDTDNIDISRTMKKLGIEKVPPSPLYHGGEVQAWLTLQKFIDDKLDIFAEERNHPEKESTSNMSPYLRFGQISPVSMVYEVKNSGGDKEGIKAFIEEAFVRRELAENFTFYDRKYRTFESLPDWARETIEDHRKDKREYDYSLEELESSKTHDEIWNACQFEMVRTGKMAGYMRMLWGKCIIEWTKTPEKALECMLYLNDKYEIDGRCPNSYAGIMWCFGKHDRAFKERPVIGKLRYMTTDGARRKFDMDEYIKKTGYKEYAEAYA
ncbi:deoxyribodipyrimidine photolyase [Methanocella sp. CWC-04]|uniref:Deoxyribodipyrimidine photo-lyase n=1 Tax=Methanooceanicella nereidis TaxID=2052831 RepID=A0AAP2W6N9_9EURY|nr:deoxyribodipyrimidine photo-lyase [Methanocella sp. CWC-04]MCD1294311.1 deoxyribodipyrimidine photolyase [Methanocella sp. CWC-04]